MSIFGNYQLERLLGRGGMADVFLAHPRSGPHMHRPVALKRLSADKAADPACVDMFLGEADLSRYLIHPNIVQVYDAGSVQESFYLAMEYIEGTDLGRVLDQCRRRRVALGIDVAFYIAREIAQGLQFAHTVCANDKLLGIVHCDVTPANIFISKSGQVKLGDFGVARTRALGSAVDSGLAGKPQYFAPELLLGQEPSTSTDVFSLGVILYEMLTGALPFAGKTYGEICDAIVAGKPVVPSKCRPGLTPSQEEVVLRSLRRQTAVASHWGRWLSKMSPPLAGRYETAEAMAVAVLAEFDGQRGNAAAVAKTLQLLSAGSGST